ncbi:hypothetical protein K461DRAFT_296454 [Myriangium duriaei CBS 260.36]|uniref:Uncharacterized protein n=1 Tax=Myriangium duriaei CBS 260.36 TaxID=1168546 RepID=A0A9P4IWX5_9PEZI|nr:hypothetical protein K461DRAFT_296454 [Myriangium duriaei CBS 260.36]
MAGSNRILEDAPDGTTSDLGASTFNTNSRLDRSANEVAERKRARRQRKRHARRAREAAREDELEVLRLDNALLEMDRDHALRECARLGDLEVRLEKLAELQAEDTEEILKLREEVVSLEKDKREKMQGARDIHAMLMESFGDWIPTGERA